ncbi:MAG: hypothetical protein Q8843_02540, partial [Candidatus Phytoplasma australasiaticum]|nr:hypothetical protein [Candidatus Phytoplasma australasiaticum]
IHKNLKKETKSMLIKKIFSSLLNFIISLLKFITIIIISYVMELYLLTAKTNITTRNSSCNFIVI